jgi:hypothetical protein
LVWLGMLMMLVMAFVRGRRAQASGGGSATAPTGSTGA